MIVDQYGLSPMQHGMLFQHLAAEHGGIDIQQIVINYKESPDVEALGRAWQVALEKYPALRTSFRWEGMQEPVQEVHDNGELRLADGQTLKFDAVADLRGVGAKGALPVRGVRGEVVWLHCPGHGLTRPIRLLHPRHRVYVVPRSAQDVLVGASEIESEDRSPVSLRSATELMAAAHSVLPPLAEARILFLDANLRPTLPDNNPRIDHAPRLLRINGLYRHGWLLAPALLEQALSSNGWASGLA